MRMLLAVTARPRLSRYAATSIFRIISRLNGQGYAGAPARDVIVVDAKRISRSPRTHRHRS